MLPDDLPPCICGASAYNPGGGTFGGSFHQQNFTCVPCSRRVMIVGTEGGLVLAYLRDADEETTFVTYVNTVLMVAWRDHATKRKAHEKVEWEKWLAEVFYPAFPALKGTIPESYAKHGATRSPFTDSSISYHDCPPEAQALYAAQFYAGKDPTNSRECKGTYLPYPPELDEALYPPQAPALDMFYWEAGAWNPIDTKLSASLTVPRDPIIVANEKFFAEVREAVREASQDAEWTEARNEYGGIEPWYTFMVKNTRFTVGWRKRVVSIKLDSLSPLKTAPLRKLATRDDTTYEAEGGWQSAARTARHILIHAWGKEKCIEYPLAGCLMV